VSRLVRGVRLSTLPSISIVWGLTRTPRCALSRVLSPRPSFGAGALPGDQSRSRGLSLGGWALLFACARFGPIRLRCTLYPGVPVGPPEPCPSMRHGNASRRSGCWPPALGRPLRRLEEPSPKSSRPLTSIVVLGHHRVGSKPTGSYRRARLLRRTQSVLPAWPGSSHRSPP